MSERPDSMSGHPFHRRLERALALLQGDAMILPAARPAVRSGDSEIPFRQDSELLYLTGLAEPDAVLVLRGHAEEERSILFVNERDPRMEQWTGLRLGLEGVKERMEVDSVRPRSQLEDALPGLLSGSGRLHTRLGVHEWLDRQVVQALGVARRRGARTGTGPRSVVDPGGILDELRLRKDPSEVAALRFAVATTVKGFEAALAAVGPGVGEWEVEAAMVGEFRRQGASAPAFAPIVAGGDNACILHYVSNSARLEAGQLVLLDAGAEVAFYSGDLTRTVPVSGRFEGAGRELHEVVEAARRAAVDSIGPGVQVARVHEVAVRTLLGGLVALGALEGDVDELVAAEAHRPWFPHQTSHWLGLDTHDPGDHVVPGESGEMTPRLLEPGMVLTVEPGLYIPPPGLFGEADPDPLPKGLVPYAGLGIRIEDDILVTTEGHENLSADLPTSPAELEALLEGR